MMVLKEAPGDQKPGQNKRMSRGGANIQGGTSGESSVYKVLQTIMDKNMAPVIVFSFSKKECEAYAVVAAKSDYNSDEEKKLVQQVFNNAISILSDEDQKLPQVESVLPILKKGIGIHHSGMLPVLKETIEILFSEVNEAMASPSFQQQLALLSKSLFLFVRACSKFSLQLRHSQWV
jgi:superfamily II RNA helicase